MPVSNELDTKELDELMKFVAQLGNLAGTAIAGTKLLDLLPSVIAALSTAGPAFGNVKLVDDEIADLTDEEKAASKAAFAAVLDLPQDKAEALAEDGFEAVLILLKIGLSVAEDRKARA